MPQTESAQHPASLSCRGQTDSVGPSSTLFPTQKKAAGKGGGFSTGRISSIQGIFQEHFAASVKVPDLTRLIYDVFVFPWLLQIR